MSLNTAEKIYLCVALIDFGGLIICLGIGLHLAYTKLDLMLGYLKNCPAVTNRAFLAKGGPSGRLFVLGGITGLMTTPRLYLRDGGASAEDLNNFPVDLKRKLIRLHWASGLLLLVMCGLGLYAEFGRG
jgi:hypothetical protein